MAAIRRLVIMVKEPHPGRVKTRLGRDIGYVTAAWWFRRQSLDLIRRLAADPRWQVVLAVSPDREGLASAIWPLNVPRVAQGSGHLGTRMRKVFVDAPPGPVVIIGADIPGITLAHIERAFRALGDHEAVFGPAEDGGYWLVGLKRVRAVPLGLFAGVRWSSEHALTDSIDSTGDLSCALVDRLRDVDRAADLAESCAVSFRGAAPDPGIFAPPRSQLRG